jgi:hypothetical protein
MVDEALSHFLKPGVVAQIQEARGFELFSVDDSLLTPRQ